LVAQLRQLVFYSLFQFFQLIAKFDSALFQEMDVIVGQFDHRLVFLVQHFVTEADLSSRHVQHFA
jgi:hypothetical protein